MCVDSQIHKQVVNQTHQQREGEEERKQVMLQLQLLAMQIMKLVQLFPEVQV